MRSLVLGVRGQRTRRITNTGTMRRTLRGSTGTKTLTVPSQVDAKLCQLCILKYGRGFDSNPFLYNFPGPASQLEVPGTLKNPPILKHI